jgi:hypothetical protein
MKKLTIICFVMLLSACTTNIALIDRKDGSTDGTGTLNMSLISDDVISVRLAGKEYSGKWVRSHCFADTCQNLENEGVRHNRHGLLGESVLKAADGSILTCEWLSIHGKLKGSCVTSAGTVFNIERDINE